ncbi:MAG: substrate-binding and VWA domain-containing protein [Actinomycetota bacterium]|nr:substrate-binding and VWA domain-containing protein [Actinomycetota bacterium]
MKPGQIAIAVIAVVAVLGVAVLSTGGGDGDPGGGGSSGGQAPAGSLRVTFAYSPEKEKLLEPLIERFNEQGTEVGGKPVFVVGQSISSGEAQSKIAKGTLSPVAWSPASSLWGRLLNFEADRPLVADDNPSLVRTPLVIAMWEPFAKALGYPKKQIGYDLLTKLAVSRQGFAAYGRPEFGKFKLVHTNPDFSTSGLSAVVSEYYAATGKKEGLTEQDVTASKARARVRDIERSIVHYGDTTLFIADQLRENGPGYASAAAMEEVTLLDFNRNREGKPKLVALYPPEGTFYSDNPFIVIDDDYNTPAEREAAKAFQEFLAEEIDAEAAGRFGFRPADLDEPPAGLVTAENGADPDQPERTLGLPEPRVLDRIRRTWREDRKPANVLLVLDTSGSMNDAARLERAKAGLRTFLSEVSPKDRIGLTIFNDRLQPLIPIGGPRDRLQPTIDRLIADGGTAFFDATLAGFEAVKGLDDRERLNAVVLLTDGEDTDSSLSADEVITRLEEQGESEYQVRIFTIAYGAEAEGAEEALADIAKASGGQSYSGDTDDIETVYRSISSFF